MINCRDNRGGFRTVATTTDLGKTWKLHPTDRKALNEPVCMASLLRIESPKFGPLLFFSNPNTPRPGVPRGRYNMTIKVSKDDGMTWPEKWHTLYVSRNCSGYSCLSLIGEGFLGVLYEGPAEIYFLRFPIKELVR
jgi:sialidase-1